MRLAPRIGAVISSVLLLQLSLLGSGALCTLHRAQGASPSAHMHGAGVSMGRDAGAAKVTATLHDAADPGTPGDCQANDSCRDPWAPGSCASMTSCGVPITAPVAVATSTVFASYAADHPEPLAAKTDLTIAPELPPPRV